MRLGVAFAVTTPTPPTVDEDLVQIGTTGSRPAASSAQAGKQFYATDTGLVYVCVPDGLGGYKWQPVGPGSPLIKAFDVDFATITPVDLAAGGDATYALGDIELNAVNMNHAAALAAGADGLDGRATNVGSAFPTLHQLLSTLMPDASLARHEVWLVARIARTGPLVLEQNACQLRMAVDYEAWGGGDAAARWVAAQMDVQLGSGRRVVGQAYGFAGGNTACVIAPGTDDEVYALRFTEGGRCVQYFGAAYSGTWPTFEELELRYATRLDVTGSPPADLWTPADATLRLRWDNAGNTTNTFSLRRLQGYYR